GVLFGSPPKRKIWGFSCVMEQPCLSCVAPTTQIIIRTISMIYSEPTNRLPEIELGRNPPRYGRPIAVLGTRPAFYAAIFLGGALLLGAISYFMSTTATTNAVMFPDATTGQGSKA